MTRHLATFPNTRLPSGQELIVDFDKILELRSGQDLVSNFDKIFDLRSGQDLVSDLAKQTIQSKAESQQIAVWKLLYWIQHLDQYTSRIQVISRPDIEPE